MTVRWLKGAAGCKTSSWLCRARNRMTCILQHLCMWGGLPAALRQLVQVAGLPVWPRGGVPHSGMLHVGKSFCYGTSMGPSLASRWQQEGLKLYQLRHTNVQPAGGGEMLSCKCSWAGLVAWYSFERRTSYACRCNQQGSSYGCRRFCHGCLCAGMGGHGAEWRVLVGAGCRATTTPALQTSRVLQARRQLPLIPTVYGMHVLASHQAPVRSILLLPKLFCSRSHGLGVGVRRCVFTCMYTCVHMWFGPGAATPIISALGACEGGYYVGT
jgi:hypothetical protein